MHFPKSILARSLRGGAIACALGAAVLISAAQSPAPAGTQPNRSPLETVQAYVAAANRGDLEAFLALYAAEIRKYRFPGTLASEGIDHMREVYTRSFAEKKGIRVEIAAALVLGDKVVCRDHVKGLPGGMSADELTAYQVQDGRIANVVYLDKIEQ